MPSFTQVLNSVANAYQRDREKVVGQAQRLTEMLGRTGAIDAGQ
ncbi:MAG: hypothetical protein R3A10_10785 [Caldilineaceae bacterium]